MQDAQDHVEKVKVIKLKDNTNREQQYMLMEDILGKGKYGKVYKAVHANCNEKVFAVKVMKLESEKVKKQCLEELQIIKNLPKSLNLVQIHPQHLESLNNFYIFLEYCDGGTLYEQNKKRNGRPCTEDQAYNVFLQLANGLLDLIAGKIYHEDIKPQNILIKNNIYKLTDFGISRLASRTEGMQLRKGTLNYMPPEKLKGSLFSPSPKTEIFSLGVTLYETIFGSHPYLTNRPNDYKQYLKMIQKAQLPTVDSLKRYFPSNSLSLDKLIRVLFKMIELNEAKRLSLQQLTDYIRNAQPFRSMKISQNNIVPLNKISKKTRYERVAFSNVVLQQSGCLTDITHGAHEPISDIKDQIALFKVCLELLKDVSSHIQLGIDYIKESKVNMLNEIQEESSINLNQTTKATQLQFICILFIEKVFNVFDKFLNSYIFQKDLSEEECDIDVESDKQFISNQFLQIFMTIYCKDKKLVLNSLKEKENEIATLIADQFEKIKEDITCVRINFKEDVLATIFISHISFILKYVKLILDGMSQMNIKDLFKIISQEEFSKTKNIISDFSSAATKKANDLGEVLKGKMEGRKYIQHDQQNSDEFEILDVNDL